MQWIMATQSLEEELTMERAVRAVYSSEDMEEVQGLCASLVRQNWHQRKLLCQAVNKIVEMDAQLTCLE
jgi:ABC-type Na+ transport system ATPase subunit NatA